MLLDLGHVIVIDDILKLRFEENPDKDFLNIDNENNQGGTVCHTCLTIIFD